LSNTCEELAWLADQEEVPVVTLVWILCKELAVAFEILLLHELEAKIQIQIKLLRD
jgi:hypothetical protein